MLSMPSKLIQRGIWKRRNTPKNRGHPKKYWRRRLGWVGFCCLQSTAVRSELVLECFVSWSVLVLAQYTLYPADLAFEFFPQGNISPKPTAGHHNQNPGSHHSIQLESPHSSSNILPLLDWPTEMNNPSATSSLNSTIKSQVSMLWALCTRDTQGFVEGFGSLHISMTDTQEEFYVERRGRETWRGETADLNDMSLVEWVKC